MAEYAPGPLRQCAPRPAPRGTIGTMLTPSAAAKSRQASPVRPLQRPSIRSARRSGSVPLRSPRRCRCGRRDGQGRGRWHRAEFLIGRRGPPCSLAQPFGTARKVKGCRRRSWRAAWCRLHLHQPAQLMACQRCHETEEPAEALADIRLWPRLHQHRRRRFDAHDCPDVGACVAPKAIASPGQKIGRFVAFGYGDRQRRPWRVTCHGPNDAGSAGIGFDVKFADLLREFVE